LNETTHPTNGGDVMSYLNFLARDPTRMGFLGDPEQVLRQLEPGVSDGEDLAGIAFLRRALEALGLDGAIEPGHRMDGGRTGRSRGASRSGFDRRAFDEPFIPELANAPRLDDRRGESDRIIARLTQEQADEDALARAPRLPTGQREDMPARERISPFSVPEIAPPLFGSGLRSAATAAGAPRRERQSLDPPTYWTVYPGGDSPGQNGTVVPIGEPPNPIFSPLPPLQAPTLGIPFGPPPPDWSSRNDPFGVMSRFQPRPATIGRMAFPEGEDNDLFAMYRDRATRMGYDFNNLTPEQQDTLYAQNAPAFSPSPPPNVANPDLARPRWTGSPAEIGNAFMNDFNGRGPDGQFTEPSRAERMVLVN
jgi:hypothetical protein